MTIKNVVILRGGGDLASGVALRLFRAGIIPLISEIAKPLTVRRRVAFAEAAYAKQVEIEGVVGKLVESVEEALEARNHKSIPVMIDPDLRLIGQRMYVLIDARMSKKDEAYDLGAANLLVGLGPGFEAGRNCHAVVETQRGHRLGRVYWTGQAAEDTGIPGSIAKHRLDRVLRAPRAGQVKAAANIGQTVRQGDLIAEVSDSQVVAAFDGVLRGLIHPTVRVTEGMKIGDLDPRNDVTYVDQVSDKALAIGGGVMEAILQKTDIRKKLWA